MAIEVSRKVGGAIVHADGQDMFIDDGSLMVTAARTSTKYRPTTIAAYARGEWLRASKVDDYPIARVA